MTSLLNQQGTVKWFRSGHGFVCNLDTEEDIFVHHSNLSVKAECYRCLFAGEFVQFDVCVDPVTGKKQASNVTGIKGFPLMCEVKSQRDGNRDPRAESKTPQPPRTK
jgi:cold shock CspA family protein